MSQGREVKIHRSELQGTAGLELLARRGHFLTSDPGSFGSTWREVPIDGLTVVEWTTTPLTGMCTAGTTPPGVVIVAVEDGLFRWHTNAGTLNGVAGSILLLAASQRVRFTIPTGARLLRIEVPTPIAPVQVQKVIPAKLGIVNPTRLIASLTSLAEVVLDPAVGGATCPAAKAIRALTVAVLDELTPTATDTDDRDRIIAYIEAHLTEPDLGPRSIADAFGISLRWAHHVFNREHESLARYIRDRRTDVIAAELRADHRLPRIGAIATRYGSPTRDQLTRAFKARYGMTLADYAEAAAHGHAPQPDSEQPR